MARSEPAFAPDALRQLKELGAYDQRLLVDGIQRDLVRESPLKETKNKFRLRRASAWADFELRLGDLRVFYRVDSGQRTVITLIGVKKGAVLIVEGEEFQL